MYRNNYLEQPVTHPTRWRGPEPVNVLDLVFVDDTDIISNFEITTRLGNSDHLSIEPTLDDSFDCYNPRHGIKRNFYRGDYVKAKELLSAFPWNEMSDMSLQDNCDL